MHPLDGPRFKIMRAQEQLHALEAEINWFLGQEPYSTVCEYDREQSRDIYRAKITHPPSPKISIMIGEFVHNLRSALDHIAWQLTRESYRIANPKRLSNIKFPIADLQGEIDPRLWFGQQVSNALGGVSDEAVAEIEALQPYHGWEFKEHPLSVLHHLWVSDKHHSLAILGANVQTATITLTHKMATTRTWGWTTGAFNDGDVIAEMPVDPDTQQHFKPKITFGVALGKERPTCGEFIPSELKRLYDFIADDAFPRFTRFFP